MPSFAPSRLSASTTHNQDSALYPFVAQLERAAGLARDETPEQKLSKLESLLVTSKTDIRLTRSTMISRSSRVVGSIQCASSKIISTGPRRAIASS